MSHVHQVPDQFEELVCADNILILWTNTQCVWKALPAADGFTFETAQRACRLNDIILERLQDVQLYSLRCLSVCL